jgi:large subunit ribosomal protein L24
VKKSMRSKAKRRPNLQIKTDDIVKIIAGADKGKTGKVLRTLPYQRKVVVQNINMHWKHLRRSQDAPSGGRLEREQPMSISNVRLDERPGAAGN